MAPFVYLVAVIDWYSRRVLSWRLPNTLDSQFCVDALEETIGKYGAPEIWEMNKESKENCKLLRTLALKLKLLHFAEVP